MLIRFSTIRKTASQTSWIPFNLSGRFLSCLRISAANYLPRRRSRKQSWPACEDDRRWRFSSKVQLIAQAKYQRMQLYGLEAYVVDRSTVSSQRERGLSVAASLDKENISTVSILTLVSTRTVSVFRLVRLALDWHAKETKTQGWQQQRRATSRDGRTRVENTSLFSGTGRCRRTKRNRGLGRRRRK